MPTSTKRGRSPGQPSRENDDNIGRKYREKYGASLVSRSTEKARRNSLKNNQTVQFEERFR